MRYLGVSRAEQFSPNRVTGDAAVFRSVAAELERRGNEVICMSESELLRKGMPDGVDCIFQMARSSEALKILQQVKVPVVNTVQAVLNCGRAAQTRLLQDSGLIPESVICSTGGIPESWGKYPCWIKRADSHAVEQDDVRFIQNENECLAAMHGFTGRGLGECVLQAHAKGWLVKFYGVRGYGLVDCYAATGKEGKFGLERFNDAPDSASVDMDALAAAAEQASGLLGLDVYGGDAVVGPDCKITIVDMNDWPSFRTCTIGAAPKIADLIMSRLR